MLNLFIDSNIWLDLYHFSNDDLVQFNKLSDMLPSDIKLYLTRQVVNEVKRNRDSKIKDALKQFKDINIKVPNLCKGYEEFSNLMENIKSFNKMHKDLCNKIDADFQNQNLHADKVILNIFSSATVIEYDATQIKRAKERYELGNPPGKDNSYGDALNWELLLEIVPDGQDIFFVSSDKDFKSQMNDFEFNSFLKEEWEKTKKSQLFFYSSLNNFINKHVKDIELKSEVEKNQLIIALAGSRSFQKTHQMIASLSSFNSFTDEQVDIMLNAALSNSQVNNILNDDDVYDFFRTLISGKITQVILDKYNSVLVDLNLIPPNSTSANSN
ncbi:hypothetical protein EHQ47_16715 [Leptospira bourretii]|uniref:PIN domain-containing protein n=1 Tax=Leptospira bourretii TaxID=2484962 RepID=UPI001090D7C8|nr:PIN domain-containing protein [Leptospira bourretii]TGL19738.1 hypothetical protein EHQ47_16715 [Leptospira bourretii]